MIFGFRGYYSIIVFGNGKSCNNIVFRGGEDMGEHSIEMVLSIIGLSCKP